MRIIFFLALLLIFLTGCRQNPKTIQSDSAEITLKKEAFDIAMDYAVKQLNDAKTSGDAQGSVYVEDSKKKYEINPRSILTGFIDGDDKPDAIVSVLVRFKQGAIIDEHLILLQSNGKLNLVRTIEQNMIIVLIAKGIITTEYHTKPRTSPLYNCEKCTEIRDYVFRDNDLIELK